MSKRARAPRPRQCARQVRLSTSTNPRTHDGARGRTRSLGWSAATMRPIKGQGGHRRGGASARDGSWFATRGWSIACAHGIDLSPTHPAHLIAALCGQHEQPHDPAVVVIATCTPDRGQFRIETCVRWQV